MRIEGFYSGGPSFAAAMLAGGAGRRMGYIDKQCIEFEGQPLGLRVVSLLSGHFRDVLVVTGKPDLYAKTSARTVADIVPGYGPLSGLHAALSSMDADWLYLAACDMPCFSSDWAARLESFAVEHRYDAIVAAFGPHIEPFHAMYSRRCLNVLDKMLRGSGASSFRDYLSLIPHFVVPESDVRVFSGDWSLFYNINHPEDLDPPKGPVGKIPS